MPGSAATGRPTSGGASGVLCPAEGHEVTELVGAEFGEPVLPSADDAFREVALGVDHLVDALLDGACCHDLVDLHGAPLADAVGTVGGLILHRRVPPTVEVDDVRRRSEVETGAPCLQRYQEQLRTVGLSEPLDHLVASSPAHATVQPEALLYEPLLQVRAEQLPPGSE